MKKYLFYVIIILIINVGCGDFSAKDLFTPKSVRTVRGDDDKEVRKLSKKVLKYEKQLKEKIDVSEELGSVYRSLGNRFIERKNWNQAIDAYTKSLGYGKGDTAVYHQLAVAYANRGENLSSMDDFKLAEKFYYKSLKENSANMKSKYGLGLLQYYKLDKKEEGKQYIENVAKSDRKYYIARFALARISYEEGYADKALGIYEQLYADLNGLPESSEIRLYKESAQKNIQKLMKELAK